MADITVIEGADRDAIADWLADRLGGAGAITIPGGSTPFPIIAALIERGGIDWAGWRVWPNDDRIVPEDHEASNTGKMRALLETMKELDAATKRNGFLENDFNH